MAGARLYYNAPPSVKQPHRAVGTIPELRPARVAFRRSGRATDRAPRVLLSDTDSDLLRDAGSGDEAAWRDLVARYTRRVFGLAYRFWAGWTRRRT